jgi:hypothetical protein
LDFPPVLKHSFKFISAFNLENMKRLLLLFALLCFTAGLAETYGQIAINEDGTPPDNSAILDLQSTSKGLLIPRIDFNNKPDPAAPGLLIYVTANGPNGNDALYLFDGTNWLKLAAAAGGLGEHKEGGVVFWLDYSGNHGLVSAVADQDYAEWGCFGTLIGPDAEHSVIGTGDTNTAAIIAGCSTPGIAASICDNLDLNGYTDWYLPSVDELWQMFLQRASIGGFATNLYWSSTEFWSTDDSSGEGAWIVWFDGDGLSGWTSKAGVLNVRCVRKF